MGFMWAALDESADRERKHIFVVVGYLARQSNWTEIERQWMRRLEQESDPQPMKYFSASECSFLSGEFSRFRDRHKYPKPQGRLAADKVKNDLQDILKKGPAAGFALGALLKEYRAIRKSSRARTILNADPYVETYTMTMICIAGDLAEQMPSREVVAFLCDEHDKAANIRSIYDELVRQNPTCGQWMGSLSHMDNKKSPALQAADLLAAECKDVLTEHAKGGPARKLRDTFRKRVGGNVGVRYLDERSLKLIVDANLPRDGRPSIYSTCQLALFGKRIECLG
jgi:plasmid stabilization system protein ParE